MRILQRILAGLVLSLLAAASAAWAAADPTHGTGYLPLARPQPAEAGGKIEVIEFFSYHCPHCYALDPALHAWVKLRKDDIVFKRVHVAWGEPGSAAEKMMTALQRAFYTLDAIGRGDEFDGRMFGAIHAERRTMHNDEAIVKFLAGHGIDRRKYLDTAYSFAVQGKQRRAGQMMANYGIDSVPNLVVDGRFVTSPSLAGKGKVDGTGGNEAALQVLDKPIAKVKAERDKAAGSAVQPPVATAAGRE